MSLFKKNRKIADLVVKELEQKLPGIIDTWWNSVGRQAVESLVRQELEVKGKDPLDASRGETGQRSDQELMDMAIMLKGIADTAVMEGLKKLVNGEVK